MTDPHPLVGRKVAGRYTITRLLGEGGMATVWVAEQDEAPREVALKIMNEELTRDRTFVRRFEREAKAASLVVHENSVKIFSWGVDKGMPYIAMELVLGADLYLLLEQGGPIGQARSARILAEVCDALQVAHGLGIVHRDLKPENIMVVAPPGGGIVGERVKVLDFGIAKLVAPDLVAQEKKVKRDSDPQSGLTQAGTLIGTPAYMSPEQCQLEGVDARSDIYTCGVLLYQLITGQLPFEGEAPLHTAMLHIHEPLRKPSEFAPNLDPGLEAVILRALDKKPDARFQTAGELGATLRALASTLSEKPAIGEGKPSSRPTRAASIPATPKRFPATLRWMGDAPGAKEEPAKLESQRTLVGDGLASAPASVRVKGDVGSNGHAAIEAEVESDVDEDPADRAKTLIREPGEDSQVLQRRSGPLGTEIIHLPPVVPLTLEPVGKRREVKPTLRSADEFRPGERPASVEIRVSDPTTPNGEAPPSADDFASAAVTLDAEARIQTMPMNALRGVAGAIDASYNRTLQAGTARRQPGPIATLEMTGQPRFVEPFPIPRARRRRVGLAQMSGARVLLLGFLAGAVLMAFVGVIYFYALR